MQASLDIYKISCRLFKLNRHKIALQATCFRWKFCKRTSEKMYDVECFLKSEQAGIRLPFGIHFLN